MLFRSYAADVSEFHIRQQLSGILKGYAKIDFNDSDWLDVPAAEKYVVGESLGEVVWFRRRFTYKSRSNTKTAVKLTIPDANQRCLFYLNGKALGQFESVGPQHDFYIPEPFLKEENVLSIILEGTDSYFVEPKLGTFYEAVETNIKLCLDSKRNL